MAHPILEEITAYCTAKKIAETTLGSVALKDSRIVARIRDGKATMRSIGRLQAYMQENPPTEPQSGTAA